MDPKAPLAYYDIGETDSMAPTVVLLHGFCENKDIWKGFEESLIPDHRIIVPDLPGFGDSAPEPDNPSIEHFADKLHDLLQFLEIPGVILIGHSMGGYVTLAFQEKYPEKVHAFGLFHSTAYTDSEEKKENRNKTIQFLEKNGMDKFAEVFVEPLFYEENREKLQKEIDFLKKGVRKTPVEGAIAAIKAMRDKKDRSFVLEQAKVPVLFIIGKDDNSVPYDQSMEQSNLSANASVHVLEKTGHMGMFEQKEETIEIVKAFADKIKEKILEV